MADCAAPSPRPKVLAFKAICFRTFAAQLLGDDRLGALLQDRQLQLPDDCVRHMLDPHLDCNDYVDEATFMSAFALTAQASGLSLDHMMFNYGRFWMPFACEKAGYLESCIHQIASNFGDYAEQHNQVVSHIYALVCKNRPWLTETHVWQASPSGPLQLGMLVENTSKADHAAAGVSMYCGMLKWIAEQVFQVDVAFSPIQATALPGGAVYQSCRISYTDAAALEPSLECLEGCATHTILPTRQSDVSLEQLGVDPCCFTELFPFHFLLDKDLRVVQAGQALKKMLPALKQQGVSIADVLMMRSPRVPFTARVLDIVLGNPKAKVVLSQLSGGVELRGGLHRVRLNRRTSEGQLLEGDEAILFMGSPSLTLTGVEEMKKLGLFMSDYPTHDPTADEALMAAARQVLATERLQEAEHNNRALKRTLARTLASHHEAMPMLQVESAGHQLLDLLESLLLGEEVEPESLLAARAALLKSGGNVWKPLEVDWSAVGGDREVNQALAHMLGTASAADQTPSAASSARISLAAYRRASASRSRSMITPEALEAAHLQASAAASSQLMPPILSAAVRSNMVPDRTAGSNPCAAASSAPDQEAVGAAAAKRQALDSRASTGSRPRSPRDRRGNWLKNIIAALRSDKAKEACSAPLSQPMGGGSSASCRSSTDKWQAPRNAACSNPSCPSSPRPSTDVEAGPAQTSALMQCERSSALSAGHYQAAGLSSTGSWGAAGQAGSHERLASGAVAPVQAAVARRAPRTMPAARSSSANMSRYILLLLLPTDQVTALLRGVDEWQFDTFALDQATGGRPLSFLAFHLISKAGLVERLHLDAIKLARFLRHIEDGYGDNPYHCRTHAADVLRSFHVLLRRGGVLRAIAKHTTGAAAAHLLGEEDEYAAEVARMQQLLRCYLAAIVHDYEHRGVNNDFLVRSCDPLALLYNDMSPLEMHHAAAALTLMQQPDFAFLPAVAMNGTNQARTRLRKDVIDMVLATDMKQHFALTGAFALKLTTAERPKTAAFYARFAHRLWGSVHSGSDDAPNSGGGHGSSGHPLVAWDADTELLVLKMALKAADLGHLTSSADVHKKWVARLEQELFLQGDRERALGQPISPLMDRAKSGIQKSQTSFFSVVARPMYTALAQAFPDCQALVDNLSLNLTHWKAVEAANQA